MMFPCNMAGGISIGVFAVRVKIVVWIHVMTFQCLVSPRVQNLNQTIFLPRGAVAAVVQVDCPLLVEYLAH